MKTRAKKVKTTADAETAMKSKREPSKKSKSKPKPSSSAKHQHRHKPKKPPTAFFFFLEDFRKTYQQENPTVKAMRDIGKACGEKWKTMSFEEKVSYYDKATEKRAEFEKDIAAYIKREESGEFSDESDDFE
ncbi:high mobility group B protein 14-like [Zingiber officinale]|uniref:HMG box domain-containing protein n=1 Tax=Zingiber officinale TaxID=94328 RepID=A0A8J5GAI5_ZINOF|nr:high mobility group B protein 14-like [Zingiber officinale]KAG6495557.1 hypothetical protein ZIOFF_043383 [Zingiber officinale]